MIVWYARVSTTEQNESRQIEMAKEYKADKIFLDKQSGKDTNRPQLREMLIYVREGDTIIVESISRFARNTRDLLELVQYLSDKGVKFISQKENIDTDTPTGKFMLTIFAAIAELERESILQRQAEGIAIAKANGKYKGRKPMEIDWVKFDSMYSECKAGKRTAASIIKEFDITPTTFYRWIKQRNL